MPDPIIDRALALAQLARTQSGAQLAATLAQLEQSLARADGPATPAFELSDEPVILLDMAGYLTGWNAGAQALFGYAAEEAIGQHVLFLYEVDGEDSGIAVHLI